MGEKQYTCPRRPVLDNPQLFSIVLKYYSYYKSGILPFSGGILDQPYKLMELVRYVDIVKTEIEAKESGAKGRNSVQRKKGNPFAAEMNKGK